MTWMALTVMRNDHLCCVPRPARVRSGPCQARVLASGLTTRMWSLQASSSWRTAHVWRASDRAAKLSTCPVQINAFPSFCHWDKVARTVRPNVLGHSTSRCLVTSRRTWGPSRSGFALVLMSPHARRTRPAAEGYYQVIRVTMVATLSPVAVTVEHPAFCPTRNQCSHCRTHSCRSLVAKRPSARGCVSRSLSVRESRLIAYSRRSASPLLLHWRFAHNSNGPRPRV